MSGATVRTPNTVQTTLLQDGQAPGSINPQDARDQFASAMSAMPNTQTTSYTLVLTDAWLCVELNSATAVNLLVPTDANVAFQIGTVIQWFQMGAGQVTIVAVTPGTTTVRNASSNTSRAQNSSGAIRKRAANDWVLLGDVT
jgi:hypothetical protein